MCENCGCDDLYHDEIPVTGDQHSHTAEKHPLPGKHHVHEKNMTMDLGIDVMKANSEYAEKNRSLFKNLRLYAINIIGGPGCGKTTIIEALARKFSSSMAVIEGDIQTRRDAERVIGAGSRARQIETGGSCHLDAHMVGHALEHLDTDGCRLLVIENVGNLVCPSVWDLGEHEKVAVLSLPEGDDKVLKYPSLFHRAGVLVINKTDLSPHMDFDIDKVINECRSLNREFKVFQVSAKTGKGMDAFFDYLSNKAGLAT